ncbi:MAG: M1 family aminopeptidase, partial [Bacteroidota bacterium]
ACMQPKRIFVTHHYIKPMNKKLVWLIIIPMLSLVSVNAQSISDSIDVLHYAIHLDEIDTEAQTIHAHTEITLTAKEEPIEGVALQLIQLQVDSVLHENASIPFTAENNEIIVPFDASLPSGDEITLDVYYHGAPFSESWGGFHFAGDYAFNLGVGFESIPHNLGRAWFPSVDDFTDRATYEYFVTVESPKKAVCGGILVDEIQDGDKTTYHWEMQNTIPAYLASVAIGEYELYEDVYEGIEEDIPIQIWVRPQELTNVEESFVNLNNILEVFENHWGPYPFSRVGFVSTANGAMEHATNIAYPYGTINGNTDYEWLYAHELSHMWFGDKTTCATAEEMWLNEGWAVFNEFLFREGIYGEGSWEEEYRDLHNEVLHYAHTPSGDGDYFALSDVPQEVTYGATSYDKGGIVVHTLRNYLGDEVFFPAMKEFLQEYAYQPATSEDLMNFLTEETGTDMQPFFDNWVFAPGFPYFEVDSVKPASGGYQVFVQQKSKGRDALFTDNRVEVFFMSDEHEFWSDTMMVSGEQQSKVFDPPFEPVMVMLDKEDKMADATTDEVHWIDEPVNINSNNTSTVLDVESVTDSVFLRITHHWAAPDTMQNPVEGLRLSDYRYWSIDGFDMENMQASCRFYYNKNNYLDHTLLLNEDDEITLMFRPDQSEDWQEIEHNQIGPATIGYLEVESLQAGEYALAVWEDDATAVHHEKAVQSLRVYPNPAKTRVNIALPFQQNGSLQISDVQGKILYQKEVKDNQTLFEWNPPERLAGVYMVTWKPESGKQLSEKVIIKR